MSEITQKFEDGTYTQDELLDWHDSYGENIMYQNSLKNLSEDQFENIYTHQDEDYDYKIGEVNQVPVIYEKNIRPKIFGANLDDLQEKGEKVKSQLQAAPGFIKDTIQATPEFLKDTVTSIPYGMAKGVDNAFKLIDELTGGSVTQLDNFFVENFPNTLGKKVEMEEPEGAGGMTGSIIGQYVVPGIGIYKLARGIMLIAEPLTVGLFSSKDEGNLMSLFEGYASKEDANIIAKTMIQSLTADEDDSEFMGRLKNIGADAIPFVAVERIYKILKALKKNPEAIQEIRSAGAAATPTEPPTPAVAVDSSGQIIKQADELVPSEKPFYSNVEKTISNFTFKKQPGNQILATLNNTAGIKQSEIQDLGLDTFLKDNPSVTKEQLDDFIADKSLTTRVKETVLEGTARQQKNDIDFITRDPEDQFTYNVPTVLRNAQSYEDAKLIAVNDEITYDELKQYADEKKSEITNNVIEEFLKNEFGIIKRTGIKPTKFQSYVTPGGDDYKEMLITAPGTPQVYTKTHFQGDVPPNENLIAHARFNTREIDGNKTLFIEEIQSDLHQAGKKDGYVPKDANSAEIVQQVEILREKKATILKEIEDIKAKSFKSETNGLTLGESTKVIIIDGSNGKIVKTYELTGNATERSNIIGKAAVEADDMNKAAGMDDEIFFLNRDSDRVSREILEAKGAGKIPDAPFKKNWYELTMKRLIKYAIDNDFDAIAFTSGDMQAARYEGMGNPEGLKGFYDNTLTKFINKFGKKYGAKLENKSTPFSNDYSYNTTDFSTGNDYTAIGNSGEEFATYKFYKEKNYLNGFTDIVIDQIKNGKRTQIYRGDEYTEATKILSDELDGFSVPEITGDRTIPYMLFTPDMKKEILTEGVPIAQVEEQEEKNTALV